MKGQYLKNADIRLFQDQLISEEKSPATVEKYLRDVRAFCAFAGERPLNKELVIAYKAHIMDVGYASRSVNSMLASINSFLNYLGLPEFRAKGLRLQQQVYVPEERELTKEEYLRLLSAAEVRPQLRLIMETICATGIRVSELRSFTVESVRQENVIARCKSKIRPILVGRKLRKKLLAYASEQKIRTGAIFLARNGRPLSRTQIWAQMKSLCRLADVSIKKVFPHNLRKLFARCFYQVQKDIAKLADVLGHSSIDTTRIYIMTTGSEHRRTLERLGLVT